MRLPYLVPVSLSVALIAGCGPMRGCSPEPKSIKTPERVVVRELQRNDIQIGNGPEATAGKKVELDYVEMSVHGKILKSTRAAKKRETVTVDPAANPPSIGAFITGMRAGGRRRVTVPFGAAYGNTDASGEPLIYEIDLVSVK